MSNELPFFKFFPSDWLSDEKLRLCSRAARGTWQDLLCLMWKSSRRGYLELSQGVPISCDQLARVVGCKSKEISQDLCELEAAGVFSCEEETGVIYSRRLVRDSKHREISSLGGSVVSEAKAQAVRLNGTKGGRPKLTQNNLTGNLSETKAEEPKEPNPQKVRGSEGQSSDKDITLVVAAPAFAGLAGIDDVPPVLTFPCAGTVATWVLSDGLLSQIKSVYPSLDVMAQCSLALAKVTSGAVPKKTAKGMPKFLFNWMDRATNSAPSRGGFQANGGAVPWQRDSHASDHSKGF